jgi:hypothetical protein
MKDFCFLVIGFPSLDGIVITGILGYHLFHLVYQFLVSFTWMLFQGMENSLDIRAFYDY